VTHRANVAALQELGARAVLAVTVCGATDPTLALGELVVFDDLHFLANRLPDGELCTLHDTPGAPGRGHWVFEDPFSPELRAALLAGARERGHAVRDGGCYGHVDGPRFNTKAEIRSLRAAGVSAVSQTAGPETVLCGEAGLPYGLLGFVTDYANGVQDVATPVDTLVRLLRESGATLASTLAAAVASLDLDAIPVVGTQIAWE
jgi:5'-methylthioadenosine phosphorylase